MKKIYLLLLLAMFSLTLMNAQDKISFGVTGGLFYGSADLSAAGVNLTDVLEIFDFTQDDIEVLNGGGFYVGFLADLKVLDDFHVQPELLYANAGGESIIVLPVLAKYYIADSFNVQVGPQLDLILDVDTLTKELVNELGVSLAAGAGFDINSKFSIQAKYTLGLNNRINDRISQLTDGTVKPSLKTNVLLVGVVFKL